MKNQNRETKKRKNEQQISKTQNEQKVEKRNSNRKVKVSGLRKPEKKNDTKKPSVLTPGQVLKHYRLKRGLELKDISRVTKIPVKQLTIIENDDYSRSDSYVFFRGFVKNYAEFLELDVDKVLAIYRRTVAMKIEDNDQESKQNQGLYSNENSNDSNDFNTHPTANSDSSTTNKLLRKRHTQNQNRQKENTKKNTNGSRWKPSIHILSPKQIVTTLGVVTLLTIIIYLVYQFYMFQKPPELHVIAPIENLEVTTDEIILSGNTDTGCNVEVNGKTITTTANGEFEVMLKLETGVNTIVVRSYKYDKDKHAAVITRNVTYTLPSTDTDADSSKNSDSGNGNNSDADTKATVVVHVEIKGESSWVQLIVDKTQQFAWVLDPGVTKDYTVTKSFSYITGKPKSTTLYVNDEEKEVPVNPKTGTASISCELDNGELVCK